MTQYLTLFVLGVIGIIGSANMTVCIILLAAGIPATLVSGNFLENLFVFVVLGVMFLVEILAWISSGPRDKFFNKTLVQIFILASRAVWVYFASFILSETIYAPLPARTFNNVFMIIAIWLLINNISGIIYRAVLCLPSIRKRFIDAYEKMEQKISPQEAPQ